MTPVLRVLREDWADPDIPLPEYETAGAAGADIRCNLPPDQRAAGITIQPLDRVLVPTGLRVAIPEGYEMQIRPRSGLAKNHGVSLPNTPGTIDSDYRGPLGVLLTIIGTEAYTIHHGDRIAQAVVAPVAQARYELASKPRRNGSGCRRLRVHGSPIMLLVFAMAGAIWFLGRKMRVPAPARWNMIGLLYVAVLALQLILPDGHPLREVTGRTPALWLILGGFVPLALAYRFGLQKLKARVPETPAEPAMPSGPFSDVELDRYARHIVLREVGGPGQKRLKEAKVLVIGAGGLGSPALLYLAGAGVGTIGVIDHDTVSLSNLQRQIIHTDARSGMPKVFSAQAAMNALNPHVTVRPYNRRLTAEIAEELFADYDLVLDGNDTFETRALVNRAAVKTGKPLISGAIAQWEGQISLFDPVRGAPCYACIFPEEPADGLAPSCAEAGVVGPLPGVIGTMMAMEAMKEITGAGDGMAGRMLLYDALGGETRTVTLKRRADCPVCGDI